MTLVEVVKKRMPNKGGVEGEEEGGLPAVIPKGECQLNPRQEFASLTFLFSEHARSKLRFGLTCSEKQKRPGDPCACL